MPKREGALKLSGTPDNLTFYGSRDSFLIRPLLPNARDARATSRGVKLLPEAYLTKRFNLWLHLHGAITTCLKVLIFATTMTQEHLKDMRSRLSGLRRFL